MKLSTKLRFNIAVEELQNFDERIISSDINKNISVIRVYNGISEALCEKLYPKYATFERKMRQLIFLVLTKAFGNKWVDETIPEEIKEELKPKAKGGNLKINEVLELFDFSQLQGYLFKENEINYKDYLTDELSQEKINSMTVYELREKIEDMRPKSLWEKVFSDLGDAYEWQERIKEIHECRNIVAHHKTISQAQYKEINKKLNRLNKDISNAILNIQNRDFTDENSVDALSTFASAMFNIYKSISEQYDFSDIAKRLRVAIAGIIEPIRDALTNSIHNSLTYASLSDIADKIKFQNNYDISEIEMREKVRLYKEELSNRMIEAEYLQSYREEKDMDEKTNKETNESDDNNSDEL